MKTILFGLLLFLSVTVASFRAQTPAPIIIQAATPAPAAPTAAAPVSNVADQTAAIQLLHEMEAANSDLLKRQQATLVTLDELQKAAEELKIFSKRG